MCRAINLEAASQGQQAPSSIEIHAYPRDWRRRSADVGGLHLALAAAGAGDTPSATADDLSDPTADRESWDQDQSTLGGQGQGWMGGDPGDVETMYAELLSDMYTQTMISVNDNSLHSLPPRVSDSKRTKLIWALDRWHFEPHLLEEEEVLACTLLLFEALFRVEGMQETISISMQQITAFIHHLRRIYRLENSYHNFEHALDVLQATQSYLKSAGVVPPPSFLFEPAERRWSMKKKFNSGSLIATLGLRELFVLYLAAIGHDVGHPGFNNHFMKNAQAPLTKIYPGSALEQMHLQLLLRVMRAHGLGVLLDDPAHGGHLRKLLVQSVLATDMGVHDAFMETLRTVVEGGKGALCTRQVVMCQAILKNADISNPTRPFLVSRHWATALSLEWSAQASLESSYQLQPTVTPSSSPLDEASSQIFFITRFARPLLELTERAVPEMRMYVTHCRKNLREWMGKKRGLLGERERREAEGGAGSVSASAASSVPSTPGTASVVPISLQAAVAAATAAAGTGPGTGTTPTPTPVPSSPRQIQGYHSAFPLTLPTHQPPPPPLMFPTSSAYSSSSSSSSSSSEKAHSLTRTHSRARLNGQQDDVVPPDSPSLSASASDDAESGFSPVSETSGSSSQVHGTLGLHRYPSISSTASHPNGLAMGTKPPPHAAAIRAASKVGSLRKKSQTNLRFGFGFGGGGGGGGHESGVSVVERPGAGGGGGGGGGGRKGARNSWCASSGLGLAGLFQSQQTNGAKGAKANGTTTTTTAATNGSGGPNPPPASAPPNVHGNGVKPQPTATVTTFLRPIKLPVSP